MITLKEIARQLRKISEARDLTALEALRGIADTLYDARFMLVASYNEFDGLEAFIAGNLEVPINTVLLDRQNDVYQIEEAYRTMNTFTLDEQLRMREVYRESLEEREEGEDDE